MRSERVSLQQHRDEDPRPARQASGGAVTESARERTVRLRLEREQHQEQRRVEAEKRTAEIHRTMSRIDEWLVAALDLRATEPEDLHLPPIDDSDFEVHDPPGATAPTPPPRRTLVAFVLPGARRRHAAALLAHADALAEQAEERARRQADTETAKDSAITERAAQHHRVNDAHDGYLRGDPASVATWLELCLTHDHDLDRSPSRVAVAYIPESRQLVIDRELVDITVVPEATNYKYVKNGDEIAPTLRNAGQRRSTYAGALARIGLRTLHRAFTDDVAHHVDSIVCNGFLDAIDPATGHPVRPCLLTVRVTRERFEQLHLEQVDPIACLRSLHASVSRSPDELVPVRPIIEVDMHDRRFVAEEDILSQLDHRPNLMALTPGEFESLITNLFSCMGLETRLTQASRDGGVDCVAFDLRPVLGGKVVIQAKRYADTVGVSAVRDLYGTVLNEGASKGILVTTSGYGQAAFDFAANKPIELVSGGNLLAMLADWAGIEAKIEVIKPSAPPSDTELFATQSILTHTAQSGGVDTAPENAQ